jgi:PKD repeat protein
MKIFTIICVLALVIISCFGILITEFHQESKPVSGSIASKPMEIQRIVSGEQINIFAGMFGNITVNVAVPESPPTMRIYRGYFHPGDLVENITESVKEINNPTPGDLAPEVAKVILESQYGGLPPDAQLLDSAISYGEIHNRTTNEIVKKIPEETFVSWWRTIEGMRIEGGSDTIQVELGENGIPIRVYKRWRTYDPLGNVSIISASKAIDKLSTGEVLNPMSDGQEDVSIYNIHLSYYVDGIDKPEVTLEPIWVFYGNTTSGNYVPFFVYARQFANFTATPTSGKVPLNVTFMDTSDASPVQWLWDFGDGTNSTEQNPAHTYTSAGIYNISLKAWNDLGSDTMEKPFYVTVRNPVPPVANFSVSPRTGSAPLSVTFNDTSANAPARWLWTFGDGANSTAQNPVHLYTTPGNYTVSLDVTNADGSDSLTKPDFITVSNLPPTTLTTKPTTIVTTPITTQPTTSPPTTKSSPRPTKQPLSPLIPMAGVVIIGLVYVARKKRE